MHSNENHLPPITLAPEGPYRCGDTITGTWTLRNWGDSVTSGMRVRFVATQGITIVQERSRIPGVSPEDMHKAFVEGSEEGEGVALRNLEPGDALNAVIAFRVGKVKEDDKLWIQAVVDTNSNERLHSTKAEIPVRLAPRIIVPQPEVFAHKADNQNFGLRIKIINEGGALENNVVVEIPIPDVVDIGDPMLPENASVEFDKERRYLRVRIESVQAYQYEEIGLQFRAGATLVGDLIEITDIVVTTPSSGSFHLEPVAVRLERHVDFSRSTILIEPGPYVESGAPVLVTVHVHNHGRSSAREVWVAIDLPEALIYAPGSLAINGANDARRDDLQEIILPLVRAQTTSSITLNATVRSPITNQERSTIRARIDDMEVEPLEFAAESRPEYPLEENYVFVEGPQTVEPHAERDVIVKVTNTGTETSRQVRVRIDAGEISINRAMIEVNGKQKSVGIIPIFQSGVPSAAIDLGEIGPQESRLVRLSIAAPETFVHGTEFQLICHLRHDGGSENVLGEMTFVGRSFPRISQTNSVVKSSRMGPLRIGQPRNVSIHLQNEGSDVARKVRVSLDLPSSLKIENVLGAELDKETIVLFHDIPAQASTEATVTLRMTGTGVGDGSLEIHPIVSGERMNTIHLEPLILSTSSQSFIDEVQIETTSMDRDSALLVRMNFKNIGDGEANNVVIKSTNLEGYAINTTTLDGNIMRDIKGHSPLAYGLNLPPIIPGTGAEIAFTVNPNDQAYVPEFVIESDDQETITLKGEAFQARLQPRFLPQYLGSGRSTEGAQRALPAIEASFRKTSEIVEGAPAPAPSPTPKATVIETIIIKIEENKQEKIAKSEHQEQTPKIKNTDLKANLVEEEKNNDLEHEKQNNEENNKQKFDEKILNERKDVGNFNQQEVLEAEIPIEEVHLKEIIEKTSKTEKAKTLSDESEDIVDLQSYSKLTTKPEKVQKSEYQEETEEIVETQAKEKPSVIDYKESLTHEPKDLVEAAEALLVNLLPEKNQVEDDEEVEISLNKFRPKAKTKQSEDAPHVSIVRGPSKLRITNIERVTAPIIIAKFDEERIEQIKGVIELLLTKDQMGWYRHVLAQRLLVADRIVGTDAAVEEAWSDIKKSIQSDLKMPVMRLLVPSFKPDNDWARMIGSTEAIEACQILMQEMPRIIESNVIMPMPEIADNELYSSVEIGNFGYFERSEEASMPFLDALLPEMIPTKIEKWPVFSQAMKKYRDELAVSFKTNAYKTQSLRHEQMIRGVNEELDDALRDILGAIESEIL